MKRRKIATRICAFALAASLMAVDTAPAFAAEISVDPAAAQEMDEESFAGEEAVFAENTETERIADTETAEEETETETEPAEEPETGTETENIAEPETETESKSETGMEMPEVSETKTEPEMETEEIAEIEPEAEAEAQYGLAKGTPAPSKVIGLTAVFNDGFSYVTDVRGTRTPYVSLGNVKLYVGKFNSYSEFVGKYGVDLDGNGSVDGYKVNNKYYRYNESREKDYWVYNEMVYAGDFASSQEAASKLGVDTNQNGSIDYYRVNGRYFKYYRMIGKGCYVYSEIAFDKACAAFSWNRIAYNSVLKNQNGDELEVGYEVYLDGKSVVQGREVTYGGKTYYLSANASFTTSQRILKKNDSVTARVRAVYYHKDAKTNTYFADAFGAWSDDCKYTFTGIKVTPAVTGVTASVSGSTLTVKWNHTVIANYYRVQYMRSSQPLAVTAENFSELYTKGNSDTFYSSSSYTTKNQLSLTTTKEMPYWYIKVSIDTANSEYFVSNACSNIVSCVVSTKADIPAVTGFKVEGLGNGNSYQLSWNPVDAKVAIYAVEAAHVPQYFNYRMLDAWGEKDGSKYYLGNYVNTTEINKYVAGYTTTDGKNGSYSPYFKLKPGVKYNFYIYTYDDSDYIRKTSQPAIARNIDGIPGNWDDAGYDHYTAMSSAAMASYTAKLAKPEVATQVSKSSVKLTMDGSDNATGFQIYRKSGSKYKKIATITDSQYTDQKLKANTKYSYKVYAYYYNPDTKKTTRSKEVVKSVTTGTTGTFLATAKKVSTTSVKLQWNKISQANKYEIYRINTTNENYNEIKKLLGKGNSAVVYGFENYQLVKTINKASTTSYTDKKLGKGESYTYVIVAYYKSGSKMMQQTAAASVAMELEKPANVKTKVSGSKVKVTWDGDKYASKYELKYTVTDKYGNAKTTVPKKASTKKTAYTIKLGAGESVSVSVRAYGSNKTYSAWVTVSDISSLAAPTNIKASYSGSKKAVKVSWKKVSGAKYYKVYRSTRMGVYNADEKRYVQLGDLIARQANNEENDYGEAKYTQYYGIQGSITGTSAYDYAKLENGVTYYYYVVAFGEKNTKIQTYVTVGNSKYYGSGKPASVVCGAAPTVTVKNSAKHTVKISYKKVSGAAKYEIYRAASAKGTYKKLTTTKKTSYSDKKATKGKTYYYKVKAIGTSGLKSDFSLTSGAKKIKVKK